MSDLRGLYEALTTTRINWLSNPVHVNKGQLIEVSAINGDAVYIELEDSELGVLSGFQHKSILNKFQRTEPLNLNNVGS